MFAKYTKSRVILVMFITVLASMIQGRAVNRFSNLWLDPFTPLFVSYCVKLYVFIYVKKKQQTKIGE